MTQHQTFALEVLLQQPEGKTLEMKRDLSSTRNILKTLVAFANTAGGVVLIGVEDKTKQVMGIQHPLDEEERLCSLIADSIEPRLVPNIEMMSWEDKTLLVVEVFPSSSRPHWLRAEGVERGVYVRLGSTNRMADADLIAELRRGVMGIAFDEQVLPDFGIDDIDFAAAQTAFERHRVLVKKDLESLRLVSLHQGHWVSTVGGMLLFGKERARIFPDAWIQCGRFVGLDKADIFDHIDIHEALPFSVGRVMEFLKKHAMRGADFSGGLQRKDVWSIPLTILREALVNAVVHADYSQKGAPIRVMFFDDRIEIENPGILLPGLTLADMMQGVSRLRNRVIARVFRELDLIEQWGSGIRRMFKEAETLGLRPPDIIEVGMRVRVTVYLANVLKVKETPPVTPPLSPPVKRLLSILRKQGALGNAALRAALALKDRTHLREHYLAPALANGLIERTLPDKPNSRLQTYRLTGLGQQCAIQEREI